METRYLVLAGAWLTQFTVIGLLFSFGLFVKVFEVEFGWSRTLFSAASALSFFMMGLLAMVGGRLSDRFGPRRVLACTGLSFGLGYALLSQVSAPWQLFALFGTLIALGMGTHDVVTLSTVARWFEGRRGLMTAVVKVGTAVGQVALPPLVAAAILWFGWRGAVLSLGGAAALVLLLAALMIQSPPAAQVRGGAAQPAATTGMAEVRRSRPFRTLCAIQFLFMPTLTTVPLHLPAHATDMGLAGPAAAALLSIVGGASIAGRLTIGRFSDTIGGRRSYALCLALLALSLVLLAFAGRPGLLYPVVALYGFAHGALFVVVSPTVAEFFGVRALGALFGQVLFFGTIGASVGPILAGRLFDTTGSYFWAFLILAALSLLAFLLALTLPRRAAAEAVQST